MNVLTPLVLVQLGSVVNNMWKLSLSVVLSLSGAIACGTSFAKSPVLTTPNPTSTRQEVASVGSPTQSVQLLSGLLLMAVGGGFAWSALTGDDDKEVTATATQPQQTFIQEVQRIEPQGQGKVTPCPNVQPQIEALPPLPTPPSEPQPFYKEEFYADVSPIVTQNYYAQSEDYYQTNTEPTPHAEILSLADEGNVGIIGMEKGSGKTSKLGWLISEHIKRGHLVWMINPFCAGIHFKGIKVFGRGYNWSEVANGIKRWTQTAIERMQKRGDENLDYNPFDDIHIHLAIDELSNYADKIDAIDPKIMPEFWEVTVQFIRQMNMSVSFASHGDTQSMLGGAKALAGKSQTIKQGITWLYCKARTDTSVPGNKRCAGWAEYVRFVNGERIAQRVEIPEWMQGPAPAQPNKKDEYNYIALIEKHCPNLLYKPKPTVEQVLKEQLNQVKNEDPWSEK